MTDDDNECPDCGPRSLCWACAGDLAYSLWKEGRTMTLTEYNDLEQGTPEWFEARRGMVAASVVGTLIHSRALTAQEYDCPSCGASADSPCVSKAKGAGDAPAPIKTLHPERTGYASARRDNTILETSTSDAAKALTFQLVAERITGYTDPTFMSDDMLRGHMDEPRARDLYSEKYAPTTQTGFLVLEQDGWKLGYSPDGLVGDDGLIEVKSPRAKTHLRTIISGNVPIYHMAQIQAGLLVTGRKWCDFLSYSGGMPMFPKRVFPDPAWHRAIVDAVVEFENNACQFMSLYTELTIDLPETERIELFTEARI